MNPIEIIKGFISRGGNPQQLIMKAMRNNNSNPMINNLVEMAKSGNSKGVENFARNLFKGKGRDFDKEYGEFMQMVNGNQNKQG